MKCVIKWTNGETVIEDCNLGDPRVADELERLRAAGVDHPISVEFQDDFI